MERASIDGVAGCLETLMFNADRVDEERGQYRLYECFIDATFSNARGGGDGIGCTKAGKGVKLMVLVDARRVPALIETMSASSHESPLVQALFDFMLTAENPERVIGDKLIALHRKNRRPETGTQDGRPLRRYQRRSTVERTIAWFQHFRLLCIRSDKYTQAFQGYLHYECTMLMLKQVLG